MKWISINYTEVILFSVRISSNSYLNKSPFISRQNAKNSFSDAYSFEKNSDNKNNRSDRFSNKKTNRSDMRQLLDGLNKNEHSDYKIINGKKVFSQTSKDKVNGFLQLAGASIDKELESIKNKPKYKYKEVSSKIRQAKTSVSAGQALLAAKRNVSEIKRQLNKQKGDSEELQLALSHAKRMEMAARKKKKHLETEELVENTRRNEAETEENSGISEQEIRSTIVGNAEDELENMEDDVLEQREALSEELSESIEENGEISEEMMSELNAMISEFGEEELKQLEEKMEMLENIEVIDPHMSEEDFKKLKIKHRTSEEKSLVKADMEYLKGMLKLIDEGQNGSVPTAPLPQNSVGIVSVGFEAMV